MKRFCVKCGKESVDLIESLCVDCFLEANSVIDFPKEIRVDYDKRSDKVKVGIHWLPNADPAYIEILTHDVKRLAKPKKLLVENLSFSFVPGEKSISSKISFETELQGVRLSLHFDCKLKFNNTISDTSMKIASYYHEAIIQIRFMEKVSLKEEQDGLNIILAELEVEKAKEALSVAIDVKKERGGYDVLVGSKKAARKVADRIAKRFHGEVNYSNKLLGQDGNGKEKYRHTFCLRFPKK